MLFFPDLSDALHCLILPLLWTLSLVHKSPSSLTHKHMPIAQRASCYGSAAKNCYRRVSLSTDTASQVHTFLYLQPHACNSLAPVAPLFWLAQGALSLSALTPASCQQTCHWHCVFLCVCVCVCVHVSCMWNSENLINQCMTGVPISDRRINPDIDGSDTNTVKAMKMTL